VTAHLAHHDLNGVTRIEVTGWGGAHIVEAHPGRGMWIVSPYRDPAVGDEFWAWDETGLATGTLRVGITPARPGEREGLMRIQLPAAAIAAGLGVDVRSPRG
jgi:hypothetical protein